MESLIQDIRYAARMLWKAPAFTLVAVIALALGIGANTVIFSVVNAVMLRPLPYPQSDRLMMLFHSYPKLNLPRATVSPLGFLYYRDHAQSFESIGALTFYRGPQNLTAAGEPERVKSVLASADVFPTLGVQPMLGRTFRAEEDQPGTGRVVVLSYGVWKRRFGGDRGILGQNISLDGANYSVIGVMPDGFQIPQGSELWVPLALDATKATGLGVEYLNVIARMKPGVTRAQVDAEMGSISQQLLQQYPQAAEGGWHVIAEPITDVIQGPLRSALFVLLAAVACVLLVACANIANLLLSRATSRMKEMAIRAAMGARRGRIVRQMLTESILLALLGGALGLLIGYWGIDALLKLVPLRLPTFSPVTLDTRVLGFTFGLAVLTGLVFGSFPALQVSTGKLSETLKEGGRSSSVHGREGVRKVLVIAEVALALVLLIVAGLMIRSFVRIQQARFGFDPSNTLTATVSLTRQRYDNDTKIIGFYQQVLQNVSTLPGVQHAAVGSSLPLVSDWTQSFDIQGIKLNPAPHAFFAVVSPQYFSALGIPFLSGRLFTESDTATTPPVCLVDDKLVSAYFRDQSPIGKYIDDGTGPGTTPHWRQIVGIVGGVKHVSAVADETKGEVYIPVQQMPQRTLSIVLRTTGDPQMLTSALRRAVTQLDPNQALYDVLPMEQYVDNFIAQPRFNMVLLGLFGGLALVLAAVGVYGVISYWVTQRTHEIGVRMALGAARGDVLQLVLRESLQLAAIGIGIGLVGSLVATRALSGLLFGTSTHDPLTFAFLAALLVGVAVLASYVPARRAAKVDPMIALRYE